MLYFTKVKIEEYARQHGQSHGTVWWNILLLNHSLLPEISLLSIDFSPEVIKFYPSMSYLHNLSDSPDSAVS